MEGYFNTEQQQTMRRASGFNQLYEYLMVKEQDPAVPAQFTQGQTAVPVPAPPIPGPSSIPPLNSWTTRGRRLNARRAITETV
jgi:hypothetical protein